MAKTEVYRNKKNDDNAKEEGTAANKNIKRSYSGTRQTQRRLQNGVSTATDSGKPLKTRTVLFVEQMRDGRLAKDIREVLKRLEVILGFKVKVVERAGTSLKNLLPNTNPWAGAHCSRTECITCNQGAEELQNCTKRNLVYENVCLECNPEAWKKGELKTINKDIPSVYVGETARSVQERAKEHWEAFKRGDKDSHIYKHWVMHHGSVGEPKFVMKVVKYHRTALSRQVGEAIRIQKRGMECPVLNSKAEFNRCSIVRLSLEQLEQEQTSQGGGDTEDLGEEDMNVDWSERLLLGRDRADKEVRQGLGRPEKTDSVKRRDEVRKVERRG